MNQEQWLSLLRTLLKILSGVLVTRGAMNEAQASDLINQIMIAIGAIAGVAVTIWSIKTNNNTNLISKAANVSEVKNIQVSDPKLVQKVAAPEVTVAGPNLGGPKVGGGRGI